MFETKILADTQGAYSRLTTMQLTYPRCVHAEFMTHRMFSRNAASSRAIPIEKTLAQVRDNPFVPIEWGRNQKGMQARETYQGDDANACEQRWRIAAREAWWQAKQLQHCGLHKQIVNRVLEPYTWITVIASGIDQAWENFFVQRCHPDADPHMQHIARMAEEAYDASTPTRETLHLPLTGFPGDEDLDREQLRKVSTARCARVSYLTHDGVRDVQADLDLHDRLAASGHWSPFEHVATADGSYRGNGGGNFGRGWLQYRKLFANEIRKR